MHTTEDKAQAKRGITQGLRQAAQMVETGRLEIAKVQAENALIMLNRIIKEDFGEYTTVEPWPKNEHWQATATVVDGKVKIIKENESDLK